MARENARRVARQRSRRTFLFGEKWCSGQWPGQSDIIRLPPTLCPLLLVITSTMVNATHDSQCKGTTLTSRRLFSIQFGGYLILSGCETVFR